MQAYICIYMLYLYTHSYIHTYTFIDTYTFIYIRMYIHIYTYTVLHTFIYAYTLICINSYVHTHVTYIYIYTHMYMHIHIYLYVYTYSYIHSYTHSHSYSHMYSYIHTFIYTYIHMYKYMLVITDLLSLCAHSCPWVIIPCLPSTTESHSTHPSSCSLGSISVMALSHAQFPSCLIVLSESVSSRCAPPGSPVVLGRWLFWSLGWSFSDEPCLDCNFLSL